MGRKGRDRSHVLASELSPGERIARGWLLNCCKGSHGKAKTDAAWKARSSSCSSLLGRGLPDIVYESLMSMTI